MQAVLGNCPALSRLECKEDRNLSNHLGFVATHNKDLQVRGIYTIGETEAKFSCLKVLILKKSRKHQQPYCLFKVEFNNRNFRHREAA